MVDIEAIVRTFLAGIYEPTRFVTAELPDDLDDLAVVTANGGGVIQVTGLPGVRVFTLQTPVVSVNVYAAADDPANARVAARVLAHEVDHHIVWELRGATVAGASVSRITTQAGPAERGYVNTQLRRFGMTYRIAAQSAA